MAMKFPKSSLSSVFVICARLLLFTLASVFVSTLPSKAQNPTERVTIRVDAERVHGAMPPVWNYFGYDEPNYTYAPNGKKLLNELTALSPRA
jgi:xylan 1,4-beta-xylosidase